MQITNNNNNNCTTNFTADCRRSVSQQQQHLSERLVLRLKRSRRMLVSELSRGACSRQARKRRKLLATKTTTTTTTTPTPTTITTATATATVAATALLDTQALKCESRELETTCQLPSSSSISISSNNNKRVDKHFRFQHTQYQLHATTTTTTNCFAVKHTNKQTTKMISKQTTPQHSPTTTTATTKLKPFKFNALTLTIAFLALAIDVCLSAAIRELTSAAYRQQSTAALLNVESAASDLRFQQTLDRLLDERLIKLDELNATARLLDAVKSRGVVSASPTSSLSSSSSFSVANSDEALKPRRHSKRRAQFWPQGSASDAASQQHQRARSMPRINAAEQFADRPLVSTRKGLVRGVTQKTPTGKSVDAFLGIPYAIPPLGSARFKHPQAPNPWHGELDASRFSNSCVQVADIYFGQHFSGSSVWNPNTPISEDCLYLNIWSPFGASNTTTSTRTHSASTPTATAKKKPVLLWIFGGGFYSGTGSLSIYNGGVLASEEDLVVVTFNYRVAALGFLYLGSASVPGNAGLFDQLLAMQWVADNIDQFGGDPSRVTLFGESAGSASVSFHMMSPLTRNLFSQAILQSGGPTSPWASSEPAEMMSRSLQLASLIGCSQLTTTTSNTVMQTNVASITKQQNNSNTFMQNSKPLAPSLTADDFEVALECLMSAEPMALVSHDARIKTRTPSAPTSDDREYKSLLNFPFRPIVDGSFLVESPAESLRKGNFKRANVLMGSNSEEGNYFIVYYVAHHTDCPPQALASAPPLPPPSSPPSPKHAQPPIPETFDSSQSTFEQDAASSTTYLQNSTTMQASCSMKDKPTMTRDELSKLLRSDVNPYAISELARSTISFEYTNWAAPDDPLETADVLDKIVGDYQFTCHVNEFAQRIAQLNPIPRLNSYDADDVDVDNDASTAINNNNVFVYYFKQRPTRSGWPKWMGVLHGDEIFFIFGNPLNAALNYTEAEVKLSKRMMRYWGNFARFGTPNNPSQGLSSGEQLNVWPEFRRSNAHLQLTVDSGHVGKGLPRARQCAFWAHHLPSLLDAHDKSVGDRCARPPGGASRVVYPHHVSSGGASNALLTATRALVASQLADSYDRQGSSRALVPAPVVICVLLVLIVGLMITLVKMYKPELLSNLNFPFLFSSQSAASAQQAATNNGESNTINSQQQSTLN